jgi:hypothetical protein
MISHIAINAKKTYFMTCIKDLGSARFAIVRV